MVVTNTLNVTDIVRIKNNTGAIECFFKREVHPYFAISNEDVAALTPPSKRITAKVLKRSVDEDQASQQKNNLPCTTLYRYTQCLPNEATHTEIGNRIVALSDCEFLRHSKWNQDDIDESIALSLKVSPDNGIGFNEWE